MTNIPGEHKKFDDIPSANLKEIEKIAKTDGSMNEKVSAENLPKPLREYKITLDRYKKNQIQKAQSYFSECQRNIGNGEDNYNVHEVKSKLEKVSRASSKLNINNEESELKDLNNTFISKKNDYLSFKKMNNRILLPVNSDPSETRLQTIIIIFLFILECMLNVSMLQGGGGTELSEAVSVSLAQATYNIVSCYIFGKIVLGSLIHAEDFLKKILLFILSIGHIYTVVLLNSNMGIFRDSIVENSNLDLTLGGESLISHWEWSPWDKIAGIDITAVMVIGVGVVLALLAYIDGYKSDDPYPGYGSIYRKALEVKKQIRDKLSSLSNRWNSIILEFDDSLGSLESIGNRSITEWSHEINTIEQIAEDYKQLLEDAEKDFDNAIQAYLRTYNSYLSTEHVSITGFQLFNDRDRDVNVIFKDVKDFFMNDDERLEKEQQLKTEFSENINNIALDLRKNISVTTEQIKILQESYSCDLN